MKKIILFFLLSTLYYTGNTQTILQGTVTDLSNGNSLIGAFVNIKGTKLAGVSDINGSYQIIIPSLSKSQKLFVFVNHLGFNNALEVVEVLPIDDGETIIR